MKKQEIIIDVAGSAKLKLDPGHYCGNKYGFGVSVENWLVAPAFRHHGGFSAGGVIDFEDIDRLYKAAKLYRKKHERLPLSRLYI